MSLIERWELAIDIFRRQKLQYGVSQVFQPLIVATDINNNNKNNNNNKWIPAQHLLRDTYSVSAVSKQEEWTKALVRRLM